MSAQQLRPITLGAAALALFCSALWGGTAVSIRFTQDALPPIGTAGLRFAMASLFVYAWARTQRLPLGIDLRQRGDVITVGLLLFAQIGLFHWGLTRTNSSHGSVLIGTHPVFVTVIAHFALVGDRLSWKKSAGLLVALVGLMIVVFRQEPTAALPHGPATRDAATHDPATLLGDMVILISSILLAIKTVYTKFALPRTDAVRLLLWSNLIATTLFLTTSMMFEGPAAYQFTLSSTLGLLYQGVVVAGFCFLTWTALLHRHRASQLAVFTFAQPLCGILLGVLLRDDRFTIWLALGGVAVALGIYLVTVSEPRSQVTGDSQSE